MLAATRRGLLFIQKIRALIPDAKFTVFSFKEDANEPPFLESIRSFVQSMENSSFHEARQLGHQKHAGLLESLGDVDVMFCVSWQYLIPSRVYNIPRKGTFVFHDSLLPRYRGFAPTVWSMVNGEKQTGVTLMTIGEDMDAGDVVGQEIVEIGSNDTITTVMENVTQRYLSLLEKTIFSILEGTFEAVAQDHSKATYTVKRTMMDYEINWSADATSCYNLVRACTRPHPGVFTYLNGKQCHIWDAALLDTRRFESSSPGRVAGFWSLDGLKGISVLCGDKRALVVKRISFDGSDGDISGDELFSHFQLSTTLGIRE